VRVLFKIMSMLRWINAAQKGTMHKRYMRVKAMRAINRHIR
jgi:hypothetical protein